MARIDDRRARLEISDQVASYLGAEQITGSRDLRGHTELNCFVCQGSIPPESSETATVSLLTDPIQGALIVRFAHERCAASHVDIGHIPATLPTKGDISYVQGLMPGPVAVLIWERNLMVTARDGDGAAVYPHLQAYLAEGFTHASDEPSEVLPQWKLAFEGDDLILLLRGEETDRFGDATKLPPAGWLDLVRETKVCLAVVGFGLGLDRADSERIEQAEAEERTVLGFVEVADAPDR